MVMVEMEMEVEVVVVWVCNPFKSSVSVGLVSLHACTVSLN